MRGEQKTAAAKNMIIALYEYGYIDDKYKRKLEYMLAAGDLEVFEEIRNYLIQLSEDITK